MFYVNIVEKNTFKVKMLFGSLKKTKKNLNGLLCVDVMLIQDNGNFKNLQSQPT